MRTIIMVGIATIIGPVIFALSVIGLIYFFGHAIVLILVTIMAAFSLGLIFIGPAGIVTVLIDGADKL